MLSRTRRGLVLTSALVAAALAISACGGSPTAIPRRLRPPTSTPPAPAAPRRPPRRPSNSTSTPIRTGSPRIRSTAIAAEVPQAIRDRGTLLVTGTAGTAPPLGFYATDDTTIIGSEIDFAYLIADVLGLKVDYSAADWAQNFVRIDSGEADAFISNVTVTEERKEKYDFATYRLDTLALETRKDTDWTVNGRKDLAGKIIAVGSGTNQEKILVGLERRQRRRGPGADRHQVLPELHRLLPGASSGRIDGYFGPNPTAQYHVAAPARRRSSATFSGAGDALQGEIAVLTQEGQRT